MFTVPMTSSPPFERGAMLATDAAWPPEQVLGKCWCFEDKLYSDAGRAKPDRTNRMVVCMAVRNSLAVAVTPMQVVALDYTQTTLAGRCGITVALASALAEGFAADEFLPAAGVPVGGIFWVVVRGPHKVISDGSAVIAAGDRITCAGSGKVKKLAYSNPPTIAEVMNQMGVALEAATNVDGTIFTLDRR